MKKNKRYIFTICLCLLSAFFSGCGKNDGKPAADQNTILIPNDPLPSPAVTAVPETPADETDSDEATSPEAPDTVTDSGETPAPEAPDTMTDSGETPAPEAPDTVTDSSETPAPEAPSGYAAAYIETIRKLQAEYESEQTEDSLSKLEYDLIYFNDDDIPELVAGMTGYWVSMYTYADGKIYTVIDHWGYGAMGNAGYEYLPRQNILRNYNSDYAGMIMNIYYGRMNDSFEMEDYYKDSLRMLMFEDANGNQIPDDGEEYSEDCETYYFGDQQLSEEEFNSKLIEGEFGYIFGHMSADEAIAALTKE